jgi:hypothetical protein
MRTKTLLLSAAVGVAGLVAASAQTVYSVNSVGYVNLTLPVGFSIMANPLDTDDNTVASLLPTGSLPNFSTISKWNGAGFDINTLTPGGWTVPTMTLNPGEAAFVNVSTETTLTFVGEVMQGDLQNPLTAGFNLVASMVPQAGTTTDLGLDGALANFSTVLQWTGAGYDIKTKTPAGWSPAAADVAVGEGFFVNTAAATSWDRTFSVNN